MAHPDPLAVLAAAGTDPDRVRQYVPLGDGTYNTVLRIELRDAAPLILKIAPDPTRPAMTYEKGLLGTEAMFYAAAGPRVPVPRPLWSGTVDRHEALLMTELPGRNWYSADERIDPATKGRLRHELGAAVALLHRVTGTGFGYPQLGLRDDWTAAFTAMVEAVLGDADRYEVSLPRPADEVRGLVRDAQWALAEVRQPVLVHFDLWPGNILVVTEPAPGLSGLVDAERAFWGDPLAEMASLGLFANAEDDENLIAGYAASGGRVGPDPGARVRLSLYRAYLYLIMTVEAVPRGTAGPEHRQFRLLVEHHLRTALRAAETR
jgi:aminoglycoside phosphotransferase (APT) family kinase protein